MSDEELKETIRRDLEPRLKKQFIGGCVAGFDSAVLCIQKDTSHFTSAKQYKEYLSAKVKEVIERQKLTEEQAM